MQPRLGEVLLEAGHITEAQLERALRHQKTSAVRKRLGEVLVESGVITEDMLNAALSKRLNVGYVSAGDEPVDLGAVRRIPKDLAVRHCLIAVSAEGGTLRVLINDPLNYYAIEDVKLITSMRVQTLICNRAEILAAIDEHYAAAEAAARSEGENAARGEAGGAGAYAEAREPGEGDSPAAWLESLLRAAERAGASDIHIEPQRGRARVRIRADGKVTDFAALTPEFCRSLTEHIKAVSVAEQTGAGFCLSARAWGGGITARGDALPTLHGERLTLRLPPQPRVMEREGTFGMDTGEYEKALRMLQLPAGLIYAVGPRGCGKSALLYMFTEFLARRLAVVTVEDPVERELPGVCQTQYRPQAGSGFADTLRVALRQDPDALMASVTRDADTAAVCARAALEGRLVLSALHAADSTAALTLLRRMGVEDYLLAHSLAGVVALRLVKTVCPACREEYEPSDAQLRALRGSRPSALARGRGCRECRHTGYAGRVAVHETLAADGSVRDMIARGAGADEIRAELKAANTLKTLRYGIEALVRDGKTTFEELLAHTYQTD
jgi:type IV pilus assembly protein PilB